LLCENDNHGRLWRDPISWRPYIILKNANGHSPQAQLFAPGHDPFIQLRLLAIQEGYPEPSGAALILPQ
jgi:hypothetical protein